ncbi:hypothetical protein HYPDE_35758 [Hyphomicrobium denitrificans 1NES1]|uniref:TM2 domain-containing protein n=1 Tax=Hyphomicrobium denitrificans 1NES1 TaxID=670307 RepID=N0B715_9HYPH|nr:hypothetical protein [Hyphomicrobium denitrificans]AGK58823.1 hypothetical protein HYPDE_35758 [Hyphomicrobium denitrificans 1NES1]
MNALQAERKPINPYLVLALAIVLPGMGHVAIGQQQRGFMFAMFTLLLALLTWQIAPPDRSMIGRSALGLFVWALSIPDAYRLARVNWETWKRKHP